jgi:hypothetical protein
MDDRKPFRVLGNHTHQASDRLEKLFTQTCPFVFVPPVCLLHISSSGWSDSNR